MPWLPRVRQNISPWDAKQVADKAVVKSKFRTRPYWLKLTALILILALCSPSAIAEHAIAMHGQPKYDADFTHFAYLNPAVPKGGTLRLGLTGSFDSINPFSLRGRAGFGASPVGGQLYLYDSLLARSQDEPFTLYALIAEDVSVLPDRSQIRFRLNEAARFHDGQPITSADVAFTWQLLKGKGRPNHRTYYNKVERIETPDARHITFVFKPDPDGSYNRELPLIMGLMPILPQHVWKDLDITVPSLEPRTGSGPYRLKSLKAGRSLEWERVQDYWARDLPSQRGLYNFDQIKIDYYRDEQVALQAFKSGQYDLRRENDPARWVTAYQGSALDQGQFRLLRLPHGRVEGVKAFAFNLRKPLFHDRVLRRAIAEALDMDWLNRVLFHGQLRPTLSYFPNSRLAASAMPEAAELRLLEPFRKHLPAEVIENPIGLPQPADLTERLRLNQRRLAAAGYRLEQGQLRTPQGGEVAFTIILNDPTDEKIALHFSRNLGQLGITARVRMVESAQYQALQNNFDYEMILVRWLNSLSPGTEQLIYWGSAAADQSGSRNYAGIKDKAVDALIPQIMSATDRAGLVTAVKALDRVLLWGFYSVPLAHQGADSIALRRNISYFEPLPVNGLILESLWALSSENPP
jgi:microcin C transport system substrate-binding protein